MGSGTDRPRWAEATQGAHGPDPGHPEPGREPRAGEEPSSGPGAGPAPGARSNANNGGAGPPAPPGDEANGASGASASAGPGRAGSDGVPAPETDLTSLLVGVERQRDEYLDSLRRLQAEFDNYRKRIERHQRDEANNAAASLVRELLPVLDTADLALAHGGGEDVKHVAGALFDILSKQGLERIDPAGQPFDPEIHDAVAHEPADGASAPAVPEVSEVMRAGYRWKGRVLRAAMVKVRG